MAGGEIENKKSIKIGVLGTHGVGKTTLALDLGQQIQKTGKFSVSILTELARECPYPMGVNQSEEATNWLISRQISRELELSRNASLLICDRTSLDALIYTQASHKAVHKSEKGRLALMERAAHDWLDSYDMLIWIRPSEMLVDDGFRMIDHGFRDEVDAFFDQHLQVYMDRRQRPILMNEISQEEVMDPQGRVRFFLKILEQVDRLTLEPSTQRSEGSLLPA